MGSPIRKGEETPGRAVQQGHKLGKRRGGRVAHVAGGRGWPLPAWSARGVVPGGQGSHPGPSGSLGWGEVVWVHPRLLVNTPSTAALT